MKKLHEKVAPAGAGKNLVPDGDLPGDDGRDETLSEVAQLVIVVALVVECVLQPVEQRYFRIGVVAADHQDDHVNQNEHVAQRGQRKRAARVPEQSAMPDQIRKARNRITHRP
jgi:hypothetical protein